MLARNQRKLKNTAIANFQHFFVQRKKTAERELRGGESVRELGWRCCLFGSIFHFNPSTRNHLKIDHEEQDDGVSSQTIRRLWSVGPA